VWGLPLVRLRAPAFRTPAWRLKRVFDVVVAGFALVLFAPLMAVIAAAVRIETGPGVILRQERVGLDGRPFRLLKFRALQPADDAEAATQWSITHDTRLGRVGRLLRQSSLDELPQLWNILRGDMSIVGPRPERPHFVDQFARLYPRYTARHRVPAGLTGWSQVHGLRGDTSIEDRARFDNYYIENWTLWLDVRICLLTLGAVLTQLVEHRRLRSVPLPVAAADPAPASDVVSLADRELARDRTVDLSDRLRGDLAGEGASA
jgi:lipopolysaccharide/colanic/teichoic acid biosynthesis glycosyltransferase